MGELRAGERSAWMSPCVLPRRLAPSQFSLSRLKAAGLAARKMYPSKLVIYVLGLLQRIGLIMLLCSKLAEPIVQSY